MNERPILFSAPMVRAILEGRKTQMRRAMGVDPHPAVHDYVIDSDGRAAARALNNHVLDQYITTFPHGRVICPYGAPGDLLWVREAWRAPSSLDKSSGSQIAELCLGAGYRKPWCPIQFEADGAVNCKAWWFDFGPRPRSATVGRGRHARFMPRWASRITLKVTDVRVERLQGISETNAQAEGASIGYPDLDEPLSSGGEMAKGTVRQGFRNIWQSINGPDSWAANPWVWVVSFERATS